VGEDGASFIASSSYPMHSQCGHRYLDWTKAIAGSIVGRLFDVYSFLRGRTATAEL